MAKTNKEEKEIIESYEKGEWQSIRRPKEKLQQYRAYAKATFKKNRRINIRISTKDIEEIQKLAMEEGLPYQTLITSILHKYITGKLKFSNQGSRVKNSKRACTPKEK
ncbi:MAG: antitoxin [Candidatus Omnitrophica bacterium]|nr:antitoxin [Candidatus Omnitrophota bacterium]